MELKGFGIHRERKLYAIQLLFVSDQYVMLNHVNSFVVKTLLYVGEEYSVCRDNTRNVRITCHFARQLLVLWLFGSGRKCVNGVTSPGWKISIDEKICLC